MTKKKAKTKRTIPEGERTLTFDISSSAAGFAYGAGGKLITYGKYYGGDIDQHGLRLLRFSKWVSKVINSLPEPPDRVIIEQPFLGRNVKTYGVLSKYVGIAQREVRRMLGQECGFITPNDVKNILKLPSGKAHEQHKINMINKINRMFGTSFKFSTSTKGKSKHSDDDAADAVGVLAAVWIQEGVINLDGSDRESE